jgi:hypothetical protein
LISTFERYYRVRDAINSSNARSDASACPVVVLETRMHVGV